ncbi:PAS domain S-box protein [Maribacter stanieri]|uniref:PAS domain S-box protein n=1 Tax=Maribacter stanieri TaxID=440514 RepID=UPI0024955973|nr:PAS domain S-box protein [Maribacter stanieri]
MKGSNIFDNNRLDALLSFDVMDTHPEAIYDEITSLAAAICNTPSSLISLVDDKRQFFKSHHGLDINGTSLEDSFCKNVISDDVDLLIVEDTHKDNRFNDYNLVKNDPNVGFYAGASLTTENGYRLGTLCVLDYQSRKLDSTQIDGLQTLAKQVVQLLELRRSKKKEKDQKLDLERKGQLLDNIVSATGIGIWERNLNEDSIILNKQAFDIFGLNKDSVNQFSTDIWFSLIHQDDLQEVKNKMLACLSYPSVGCSVQYRFLQEDGTYKWVHEKGKVLKWSDTKKPLAMYGTIQDITDKKNYNTELQRVKNNQEAMINSTKDLMWSIDLEFKLITANTAFHELVTKIQGKPFNEGSLVFSEHVAQQVTEKWKSYYNRALTSGRFSVKQKIQNPRKFWTTYGLTSFDLLYNKEGEKIGITCFSKDITSEVLSQQVLMSAKEEMQKIMDTSLDIICTLDEEGYFLSINKACKRVWGYNPKDLIGTNYLYLVFKDDVELTKISAEAVSSGEKIVNFENRYVHKNGTIVPMLWSSNWDEKDRIYYCIARDNTEKKKAIEQLENSERRYKTLVQEGSDMICIVDEKAVFSYASPTSTKILNITPEEFVDTNAFEYVHPDDSPTVYNEFIKVLDIPQVAIKPFRFKHGDGHWIWLETIITNKLTEPSIMGIVVNSKDVTTKVQHLKAIEEQNAQLKKIAWTQSHIVRAPVARLMGLIDLLKDEKEKLKLEEKERILNYIITSADEIDHVIKDIVENTINAIDLDEIT